MCSVPLNGRRVATHMSGEAAMARALPEPGPLQLTRRHDLLDIDIAPPDLNAYEIDDDE